MLHEARDHALGVIEPQQALRLMNVGREESGGIEPKWSGHGLARANPYRHDDPGEAHPGKREDARPARPRRGGRRCDVRRQSQEQEWQRERRFLAEDRQQIRDH